MKILLFSIALCFSAILNAQQIVVEFGRNSTQFDYKNSEGEAIENLFPSRHFSYSAGYRKHLKKVFYFNGAVNFNRYGMIGSDLL